MNKKWSKKIFTSLRVLLLLFFGLAYFSSLKSMLRNAQIKENDHTFLAQWEKRFEPIKKTLPLTHGTIGYVSDLDLNAENHNIANVMAEHILSQYTMAPIILSKRTNPGWLILNLSPENFSRWEKENTEFYDIFSYPYNLYLVHRLP